MNVDIIGPFPIIIWKEILNGPRSKHILTLINDLVNIGLTCKSLYDLIWNTPNIIMNDPKFNSICPICNLTLHEAMSTYHILQNNIKKCFGNNLPHCYLPVIFSTDKCPCQYCKDFTDHVILKNMRYCYHDSLIFSLSSLSAKYSSCSTKKCLITNNNHIILAVRFIEFNLYRKALILMKYVNNNLHFSLLTPDNLVYDSTNRNIIHKIIHTDSNIFYSNWTNFIYNEFNNMYQFDLHNLGQTYLDYQSYNYYI